MAFALLLKQKELWNWSYVCTYTENFEIFERVLFLNETAKFGEINPSQSGEIILSFIEVGRSCSSYEF